MTLRYKAALVLFAVIMSPACDAETGRKNRRKAHGPRDAGVDAHVHDQSKCLELLKLYEKGFSHTCKTRQKTIRLFRAIRDECRHGAGRCCFEVSNFFRVGVIRDKRPDSKVALYSQLACKYRYHRGCAQSLLAKYHPTTQRQAILRQWKKTPGLARTLQKECHGGSAEVCSILLSIYRSIYPATQLSHKSAVRMAIFKTGRSLCAHGDCDACIYFGIVLGQLPPEQVFVKRAFQTYASICMKPTGSKCRKNVQGHACYRAGNLAMVLKKAFKQQFDFFARGGLLGDSMSAKSVPCKDKRVTQRMKKRCEEIDVFLSSHIKKTNVREADPQGPCPIQSSEVENLRPTSR